MIVLAGSRQAAIAAGILALAECAFGQQCGSYFFKSDWLPPEGSSYVGAAGPLYPNGVALRNIVHTQFASSFAPPMPGFTDSHTFGSMVYFDFSWDSGATWQRVWAPAITTVQITFHLPSGNPQLYDTEMTQLDIAGGTLPLGVQVRESPIWHSTGQTSIETVNGGYMISSFFDVFTELSLDGGQIWQPDIVSPTTICMTPEPSTFGAIAAGLGVLAALRRRRAGN